jgi:hypothetical protein
MWKTASTLCQFHAGSFEMHMMLDAHQTHSGAVIKHFHHIPVGGEGEKAKAIIFPSTAKNLKHHCGGF